MAILTKSGEGGKYVGESLGEFQKRKQFERIAKRGLTEKEKQAYGQDSETVEKVAKELQTLTVEEQQKAISKGYIEKTITEERPTTVQQPEIREYNVYDVEKQESRRVMGLEREALIQRLKQEQLYTPASQVKEEFNIKQNLQNKDYKKIYFTQEEDNQGEIKEVPVFLEKSEKTITEEKPQSELKAVKGKDLFKLNVAKFKEKTGVSGFTKGFKLEEGEAIPSYALGIATSIATLSPMTWEYVGGKIASNIYKYPKIVETSQKVGKVLSTKTGKVITKTAEAFYLIGSGKNIIQETKKEGEVGFVREILKPVRVYSGIKSFNIGFEEGIIGAQKETEYFIIGNIKSDTTIKPDIEIDDLSKFSTSLESKGFVVEKYKGQPRRQLIFQEKTAIMGEAEQIYQKDLMVTMKDQNAIESVDYFKAKTTGEINIQQIGKDIKKQLPTDYLLTNKVLIEKTPTKEYETILKGTTRSTMVDISTIEKEGKQLTTGVGKADTRVIERGLIKENEANELLKNIGINKAEFKYVTQPEYRVSPKYEVTKTQVQGVISGTQTPEAKQKVSSLFAFKEDIYTIKQNKKNIQSISKDLGKTLAELKTKETTESIVLNLQKETQIQNVAKETIKKYPTYFKAENKVIVEEKPIQIIQQENKEIVSSMEQPSNIEGVVLKQIPQQKYKEKQTTSTIFKISQTPLSKLKYGLETQTAQQQILEQKSSMKQENIVQQKLITEQKTILKQQQALKQESSLKQQQALKQNIKSNLFSFKTVTALPQLKPFFFKKEITPQPKESKVKLFIKRKGRFERAGEFATSEKALARGKRILDITSSASLKITDDKGNLITPKADNRQFKESKKTKGILVEQSEFRISTAGEIFQISKKGQEAQKKSKINFNL